MAVESIVVEALTAARLRLVDLTDSPTSVDPSLVELLRRARAGEDVDDCLVQVLSSQPRLHEWVVDFIETWPPQTSQGTKGAPGLAGRAAPVAAPRYVCPVDGLVSWYRRSLSEVVPSCPDHPHERLVPDSGAPT